MARNGTKKKDSRKTRERQNEGGKPNRKDNKREDHDGGGSSNTWLLMGVGVAALAMLLGVAVPQLHSTKASEDPATLSDISLPDDKVQFSASDLKFREAEEVVLTLPTMDPTIFRNVTMKPVASRPRLFVMDDYLTEEECDKIIELAMDQMQPSRTFSSSTRNNPQLRDLNGDGFIDLSEMRLAIGIMSDIHLTDQEVMGYYQLVDGLDRIGEDGLLTREHMKYLNLKQMMDYVENIARDKPERRGRYADQAWLRTNPHREDRADDVVYMLEKRVGVVLGVHPHLAVRSGESQLQVVRYQPKGHYNTHFDSSNRFDQDMKPPQAPTTWGKCCHITRRINSQGKNGQACRSCRFATLLYYLQQPDAGGGETAFPFVGQEEFNELEWRASPQGDASSYCASDGQGVRIAPKKGRAVLFLNHLPPSIEEDGQFWFGAMDRASLHASCPVQGGGSVPKIMANHWIELSDDWSEEMASRS